MDVNAVLSSAGLRPASMRTSAVGITSLLLAVTAYGLLVPPTMTWLTLAQITRSDDPILANVLPLFGVAAVAWILGLLLGTQLLEHRWPWPLGPHIGPPTRPGFNRIRGALVGIPVFVVIFVGPAMPHATALYSQDINSDSVLRVVAPVDFAYGLVYGVLVYVMTFSALALAAAAWRSFRSREQPGKLADAGRPSIPSR